MRLVDIVLLTGSMCISPIEQKPSETIAYKVPCAILIHVPDANPFKRVQEANVVSVDSVPGIKKRKASKLCGAKTAVWYVKNNKRRYRCR